MTRPRLVTPDLALHGAAVALGLVLMLAISLSQAGPLAAALISSGATAVSLAHAMGTPRRVTRTLAMAAALCALATACVFFAPATISMALPFGLVGFVATLTAAWGPRAGALSFSPVLAFVFTLAFPRGSLPPLQAWALSLLGMGLYVGWGIAVSALLQPLYRREALAACRAAIAQLQPAGNRRTASSVLTQQEATWATRLQAARDVVFPAGHHPAGRRQAAELLALIDQWELMFAARASTTAAASTTSANSAASAPTLPTALPAAPPTALTDKLPLSHADLQTFVTPESFPLRALRSHLTLASPTLRHALRTAVALACAEAIGRLLNLGQHSYWLPLTVAVVLRGTFDQTLARFNARLTGSVVGCVFVSLVLPPHSAALTLAVFFAAVALSNWFFFTRYWVTAACTTILAALQLAMMGTGEFPIGERLADTAIGATLALAFSHVLPSWERRSLPAALNRVLNTLLAYAEQAFTRDGSRPVAYRLARSAAHQALCSLAAVYQRTAAEPHEVRVPAEAMLQLLAHGHHLLSQLAALHLRIQRAPSPRQQAAMAASLRQLIDSLHTALQPGASTTARPHPMLTDADALSLDEANALLDTAHQLSVLVHDTQAALTPVGDDAPQDWWSGLRRT